MVGKKFSEAGRVLRQARTLKSQGISTKRYYKGQKIARMAAKQGRLRKNNVPQNIGRSVMAVAQKPKKSRGSRMLSRLSLNY